MKLFHIRSLSWGISILLFSACAGNIPADSNEPAPDSSATGINAVEPQRGSDAPSCDSCQFKFAELSATEIPLDSRVVTFNQATVVEFFPLAHRKDWYDSLDDHHQTYYYNIDQYGLYMTLLRPKLNAAGVNIIDEISAGDILLFEDKQGSHYVDIRPFRGSDGVLMWTPGKVPVLWTAKVASDHCHDSTWISCYFEK